jgi:homocysteine S-methyltransferase
VRTTKPVILDGGMSNALEELGHDVGDRLWTARLLRDAPEAVAEVHRRYFAAGAVVATTASYQASVPGFVAAGLEPSEAEALVVRSVTLARAVRDEVAGVGVDRRVAASVGPYGAYLADGSEYRGRYGVARSALRDFHGPRLELLLSGGPDLLAVETVPDIEEAEVLVDLLADVEIPTWFSFSARGGRTAAGQPLPDAFSVAAQPDCVVAVGVNCLPADEVADALRLAGATTGKAGVAYPNGGGEWDPVTKDWRGTPGVDPAAARAWVDAGATYVGGCCRVGPADIARLADALR